MDNVLDNDDHQTGVRQQQLKHEIIKMNIDPMQENYFYFLNRPCKRPYNEDRAFIILKKDYQIFGVFDGHGGKNVSQYSRDYFYQLFQSNPIKQNSNLEQVKQFFQKHIDSLQQKIETDEQFKGHGSTMNVVYIDNTNIFCLNLGDSRSIGLKNNGLVNQLTIDHKPYNIIEQELMKKQGTFLQDNRVNGILAVSRALGDSSLNLKRDIDIYKYKKKSYKCICTASDGIFDVLQQQEIFDRVNNNIYSQQKENPLTLLYKDYKEDFEDNISMIYYIIKN